MSDDRTHLTFSEFKIVYKNYAAEHLATTTYHPSLNRQSERFIDTFKWAIRKAKDLEGKETVLQEF